jgi:nicotinamide riboside kinase
MYVMKVWSEFVFGKCHPWILRRILERKYDFYLLCNIDLPWVKDELREYPELAKRQQLYLMYKDILINQTVPWSEISGGYEQRLKQAIEVVNKFLNQ